MRVISVINEDENIIIGVTTNVYLFTQKCNQLNIASMWRLTHESITNKLHKIHQNHSQHSVNSINFPVNILTRLQIELANRKVTRIVKIVQMAPKHSFFPTNYTKNSQKDSWQDCKRSKFVAAFSRSYMD